jgi:hypothetical protein
MVALFSTLAVLIASAGVTSVELMRGTEVASAVGDQVVISPPVSSDRTLTFAYTLADSSFTGITDFKYRYMVSARGTSSYGPLSAWISMGTTSTAQPLVMTGLNNGDNYYVQIVAVNSSGNSTGSWDGGRPYKPAGPPTINTATSDNGTITLGITPPVDDGGSDIVTYFYQLSTDGGTTWNNGYQRTPVNNVVTILNVGNNTTYKVRICANTGAANIVGACELNLFYSNAVDVVMPVAASLSLTTQPGGAVYNQALTTQPQVQLKNSSNQNLALAGVQVTASIDTGTGSVISGTALTNASGLATFSGLTLDGVPATGFKLKFSITNLSTPATSNAFELAKLPQSPVTLTVPATGLAGEVVNLSASGGSGTGAISYSRSNLSTCTVTNNGGGWTATLGDASSLCTLTATRAADTYYSAKDSSSSIVTISKRSQTLSFTSTVPTSPFVGDSYTPQVSSTQSLSASLTSTTTGVCTFAGTVLNFLAAGTCTVRATQAGTTNVFAAQAVDQSIVVGMRNQNITFPALGNVLYGAASFSAGASVDSGLPLAYSSSTPSVCTVGASTGIIAVSSTGSSNATCSITVSQLAGNASYAPANSVTQAFQVEVYVPSVVNTPPTQTPVAPAPSLVVPATTSPLIVPTPTPTPTPTPNLSSTPLIQPSGTVGALVNGVLVTPVVVIQESTAQIEVPRVVNLTVWSESTDGVKAQLKSESKIVIAQGSEILVTGDGFQPQSPITTSVDNDSIVLGTGTVALAGTVAGKYNVSSAAMLGDRVIRFSGISSDGHAVTVAMGVTILAAGEVPAASPVSPTTLAVGMAAIAIVALAAFFWFLLLRRRERKSA